VPTKSGQSQRYAKAVGLTKRRWRAWLRVRESGSSVHVAGGKATDDLPFTRSDGPLSLTSSQNKRLDSVRFYYYTLLDVYDEFLFVFGNNQHLLLYKN